MEDWKNISQLAGGLSVTVVLLYCVWALINNKVLTRSHHDDVVAVLKESEQRAWDEANRAREELKANNAVLERMADGIASLRATVDGIGKAARR